MFYNLKQLLPVDNLQRLIEYISILGHALEVPIQFAALVSHESPRESASTVSIKEGREKRRCSVHR